MIQLDNIHKSYGRRKVLRGVSFEIAAGDSVALWGGNGAGKTTALRCILGLTPYEGTITVGGIDAGRAGTRARSLIGYVPQELPAHGSSTPGETLDFVARLRGVERGSWRYLLDRVELTGEAGTRIEEFSGGMKQRLALAMALINDPPVLLLDEATAGLDLASRRSFIDLLKGVRDEGRTLLFTTHRPDEIEELAGRAIALDNGLVAMDGDPSGLIELLEGRPVHDRA